MVLSSSIVPRASSTFRSVYARIASARIKSTRSRKFSSSLSYSRSVWRRSISFPSAETARDVVFGALLFGAREDHVRAIVLDELTQIEECRKIGDASGLLHVVRHDHDRVGLSEFVNQLFDARRSDWVERRARLVHE